MSHDAAKPLTVDDAASEVIGKTPLRHGKAAKSVRWDVGHSSGGRDSLKLAAQLFFGQCAEELILRAQRSEVASQESRHGQGVRFLGLAGGQFPGREALDRATTQIPQPKPAEASHDDEALPPVFRATSHPGTLQGPLSDVDVFVDRIDLGDRWHVRRGQGAIERFAPRHTGQQRHILAGLFDRVRGKTGSQASGAELHEMLWPDLIQRHPSQPEPT